DQIERLVRVGDLPSVVQPHREDEWRIGSRDVDAFHLEPLLREKPRLPAGAAADLEHPGSGRRKTGKSEIQFESTQRAQMIHLAMVSRRNRTRKGTQHECGEA